MALVVEDGSIVTGANTYVSLAEFKAWADDRSITYGTDEAVTAQILRAMDYIEAQYFIGYKDTQDQPLQWPRSGVVIDGFGLTASEIPTMLKSAVYEATKVEIDGDSKLAAVDRTVTQETVGDISISYKDNASMQKSTPALRVALQKLVRPSGMVMRA